MCCRKELWGELVMDRQQTFGMTDGFQTILMVNRWLCQMIHSWRLCLSLLHQVGHGMKRWLSIPLLILMHMPSLISTPIRGTGQDIWMLLYQLIGLFTTNIGSRQSKEGPRLQGIFLGDAYGVFASHRRSECSGGGWSMVSFRQKESSIKDT